MEGPAFLDDRARAACQARLVDLRDELEETEGNADIARSEAARAEMDAIASELAGALGLGGRARAAAHPAERARKSIRTGAFCTYQPERAIGWSL